jgi:DnaJ-class molecular chaperone
MDGMNYQKAYQILEINNGMDPETIKKHYRALVLKNHPDKNTDKSCVDKFREIHAAYYFLKNEMNTMNTIDMVDDADDLYENNDNDIMNNKYNTLLFSFLKQFIHNDKLLEYLLNICNSNSFQNSSFMNNYGDSLIYKNIKDKIEMQIIALLEKIDTPLLTKIYEILRINSLQYSVLDKIKEIIKKRGNHVERKILYPSLNDIFECNLYRLVVNNQTFIVPLWHHEIIYDLLCNSYVNNNDDSDNINSKHIDSENITDVSNNRNDHYSENDCKHKKNDNKEVPQKNKELIVECNPILPDNITIDSNNNIHVKIHVNLDDIWGISEYMFSIANQNFIINVQKLKMMSMQTIILMGQGIPRICKNDIYNCEKKSDIVIHLQIHKK